MPDGDAPDPAALSAQWMADLQASNPQLAMLAQMMQARTLVAQPASADLSDEIADLAERLADAERRIASMKRQGQRLYAAHQEASGRLADLAAALGACGLCWGEDDDCPSCRGRGYPGAMRPDPLLHRRLFEQRTSRPAEPAPTPH
jgi:hypothetical protein